MRNNLRPLCRKLQQALAIQRNRRISINQYQTYSSKANRTVTKYVLSEYQTDDKGKGKYKTLLETWALPEVVKFLVGQLQDQKPTSGQAQALGAGKDDEA